MGSKETQNNQQVLLAHILEKQRAERASTMNESDYFEIFVAEQLLKKFDLSDEEISNGIVDDPDDGGIDGFFTFVNDELLVEDAEIDAKRDSRIEVVIFQSKRSDSFSEVAVDKMKASLAELLDLNIQIDSLRATYCSALLNAVAIFRNALTALASAFPKRNFAIYYATHGIHVHAKVQAKLKKLESSVKKLYSDSASSCVVRAISASDLYEMAQKSPRLVGQLTLAEKLDSNSGGIVALVKLSEYYKFISDDNKRLRRRLFEANVRDYQGKVEVNKGIQECLSGHWPEEFWWLNNGITIVANKVSPTGKVLSMEEPQIVNGLQTSREVIRYFEVGNTTGEEREILVRIISPESQESRDRVIKATNSQTSISPASLRATDEIQRNIEQYLKAFGIYYDRHKNFYKNEGKPRNKIVSIPLMAQALMAVMLQQPDTARARPSSLLKKNEDYERVFNPDYPIEVFRAVIELVRAAEEALSKDESASKEDRVNLRFYLAMHLAAAISKTAKPNSQHIKRIAGMRLAPELINDSASEVKSLYIKLGADSNVAKGREFRDQLVKKLERRFSRRKPAKKK